MGKIKQKRIRWNRSETPDVINYKLYWSEDDGVSYDSNHVTVGNVTELLLPDDLPSFPLIRSKVTFGVSAVDGAGNESDISKLTVDLDFTIPEAPKTIQIEDLPSVPAAPNHLQIEDL